MTCAVRQLVKSRAVIGGGIGELLDVRKRNAVAGGMMVGLVAVLIADGHAAALHIIGNYSFGLLVCVGGIGKLGCMLCGQALALGEMKDAVIAQEGNPLLLAGILVLLLNPLPEDDHLRHFPLPEVTALVCALMKRDVLAGLTKK